MQTLIDQTPQPFPPPQEPVRFPVTVIAVIAITVIVVAMFSFLKSSPKEPDARLTLTIVLREIERGDRSFKDKLYSDALDHYEEAAMRLDYLVIFETKSPKANYDVLQHYYNIQVILGTKTRIAEIGLETSTI